MITIRTISLLAPLFFCFVFFLLFFPLDSRKDKPKNILWCYMIAGFLFGLTILVNQMKLFLLFSYVAPLYYALLLCLIPLFYIYIWSLTKEWQSLRYKIKHFTPAILYFIASLILFSFMNNAERIDYSQKAFSGIQPEAGIARCIWYLFITNKYIYTLQVFFYFFLIYKTLKEHKEFLNEVFSNTDKYQLNWLSILNFAFLFGALNGLIIILLPTDSVNSDQAYLPLSLLLYSVFFLILGVLGNNQKPLRQIIEDLDTSYISQQLNNKSVNALMQSINDYCSTQKAFKNPDLDIWKVASSLNTNRSYISKTINTELGINFKTYINKIRINEAIKILNSSNQHSNMEDIYIACGFNSASTFYRTFKQETGKTPKEYFKIEK